MYWPLPVMKRRSSFGAPLPDYIVEKRFAEPIATDTMIAMTLSRLADTLIASMEKQGKGARRLEAAFFRTDGVVRAIMVETGRPVTRSAVIDRLFRERLDALADPLDPGFGFDLVRLRRAAPRSWCRSSAISTPMSTTMTSSPR